MYCNSCFSFIPEGLVPPKCHLNCRSEGTPVGVYCSVCGETTYNNRAPSAGHTNHIISDTRRRNESIQNAMRRAENDDLGWKIYDKGEYVAVRVSPNEVMSFHNSVVKDMVKRVNQKK